MYRISNIKLALDENKKLLRDKILKKLKISEGQLIDYSIYKESIDARNKNDVFFVYTIDLEFEDPKMIYRMNRKLLTKIEKKSEENIEVDLKKIKKPPVVIGFGPAGMFAALTLAKKGLNPIVFERGEAMDERIKTVNQFWQEGILNPESNVQFGEGGAGTFSDGKLTARVKKGAGKTVLEELVNHGADDSILYMANPHLGTDMIRTIAKNIRAKIEELGGKVNFGSKLTDFKVKENKIVSITINDKEEIKGNDFVLAIGHSARDTFELLEKNKTDLSAKEFAVGFRVEHAQELIDKAQYGKFYKHKALSPAEYKLAHNSSSGRGVYTFCMCPGGYVISAASEEGAIVTNGMSNSKRDGSNANSAIVVQVKKEDFADDTPLAGVKFQQDLEKKAFILGGSDYKAPSQTISGYLKEKELEKVKTTYNNGVKDADLNKLLPEEFNKSIKEAIKIFDKKIDGFKTGVLTGIETRTSSPVRINREKNFQSLSFSNLYPIGEGSGYSGGIITSAIDGINGATEILKKYI